MANGTNVQISQIKKGDRIQTLNGAGTVKCLLKFVQQNSTTKLCQLSGGLKITHKHPVLIDGKWIYPKDISQPVEQPCAAVFNLVIDQNHIAIINGVPVILLGHDYTSGILKDEYLGSDKVVDDIK